MVEKQEGLLPEDLLTCVLSRLAPRYLARSRCVCKAWRIIIDDRRLLHADLLPHSLGGIIINLHDLLWSEFFSRPSTGPTVSGSLDYLPCTSVVRDHCNGLLLLNNHVDSGYVVNPATRRWVQLPPSPCTGIESYNDEYLVFDPTLSPHYEVFLIPRLLTEARITGKLDPTVEESEWPPSPYILHVFSSRTKRWEERSFIREGEAAGTIADMRLAWRSDAHYNAVYWRGAHYVHCQTEFVMRISLSNNKYQVIKPPREIEFDEYYLYLGRSEKGVYCALADFPGHMQVGSSIRVWVLDELYGQMEWVLKHHGYLMPRHACEQRDGPWIMQDVNYNGYSDEYKDDNNEAIVERKFEWDSENDDIIDPRGRGNQGYISFLGFHPYKEVVFLNDSLRRGLAYHLNSLKVQDLGNLRPKLYGDLGTQPFL